MAIIFFQEKKRQKYLVLALGFIILLIFAVFKQGAFVKPPPIPGFVKPPEIKINFEALESPILEKLQPFGKINPFEGQAGRENPFSPY